MPNVQMPSGVEHPSAGPVRHHLLMSKVLMPSGVEHLGLFSGIGGFELGRPFRCLRALSTDPSRPSKCGISAAANADRSDAFGR